jgi:hypothetical protein
MAVQVELEAGKAHFLVGKGADVAVAVAERPFLRRLHASNRWSIASSGCERADVRWMEGVFFVNALPMEQRWYSARDWAMSNLMGVNRAVVVVVPARNVRRPLGCLER